MALKQQNFACADSCDSWFFCGFIVFEEKSLFLYHNNCLTAAEISGLLQTVGAPECPKGSACPSAAF